MRLGSLLEGCWRAGVNTNLQSIWCSKTPFSNSLYVSNRVGLRSVDLMPSRVVLAVDSRKEQRPPATLLSRVVGHFGGAFLETTDCHAG